MNIIFLIPMLITIIFAFLILYSQIEIHFSNVRGDTSLSKKSIYWIAGLGIGEMLLVYLL